MYKWIVDVAGQMTNFLTVFHGVAFCEARIKIETVWRQTRVKLASGSLTLYIGSGAWF